MPLQKQLVPIDFTGGLDNKTDSKLVVPGKLTTLENGVFQASNTISKRTGFADLSSTMLDGSGFGSHLMSATFKDELLRVDTDQRISTYASRVQKWIPKGYVPLNTVATKPVVRNTATQTSFDCWITATISCFVWQDSRGGVRVTVVDETSSNGASYFADYSLSSTGTLPRVVFNGSTFCVIYAEAANLRMRTLSSISPGSWAAAVSLKTDMKAPAMFDAYADTTGIWVAYQRSSDSTTNVFCTNAAAGVVVAAVNYGTDPNGCIHIKSFNSGAHVAVIHNIGGTSGATCKVFTSALVAVGVATIADPDVLMVDSARITSIGSGATLTVFYEYNSGSDPGGNYNVIGSAVLTAAATVGATTYFIRGLAIASTPFLLNGQTHLALTNNSKLQPTLFVVAFDGNFAGRVVAKALVWRAAGFSSTYRVPYAYGASSAVIPVGERGRLAFNSGQNITPIGITRLNLSGATASERVAVELNQNLFFASAAPSIYDGNGVTEQGFHIDPEIFAADQGAGGALANGTYQVTACFEWVDAQGNAHRSAFSVPSSVTISAGGGVASLVMSVPALRLTQKTAPLSEATIVFFRTIVNGSVFFRANSAASPLLNNPAGYFIAYTDTSTDAAIQSNEIVDPSGEAVLENEPCPPCRIACVHQGRLVVAGLDGFDGVAYSRERVDGEGIAFNEILTHVLPETGGALSALASQDDKLLISREDRWFYVAGEGPNAAGQQNGYTVPQLVAAETGARLSCSRSLQVTDDGVWFQSSKGMRLLSRGLSILRDQQGRFIGSEVDPLVAAFVQPFASSILDRSNDQVRFYMGGAAGGDPTTLVWDEHWRQWSAFTNYNANDAVRWGSALVHGYGSGAMRQGNTGYTDANGFAGAAIAFELATGWLALAGVQGFQRVYKLLLLGTFSATSTLSLEVGYDYADAYQTPVTLTTGTAFSVGVPIQLEYRLPIQKCGALRFRIIESAGTSGFALSSFALLMGGKGGAFKLPATKVVG